MVRIVRKLTGQSYKRPAFQCYYCDEYKSNDECDYTVHVINVHHEIAFPNKAQTEKEGLKPQGKPWET